MTRSGKRSGSRPVSFSRRCSLCKRSSSGDLMFFNVLSCMTSGLRLLSAPAASKSSTDAKASLCGLLLAGCENHLSSNCFNLIGTRSRALPGGWMSGHATVFLRNPGRLAEQRHTSCPPLPNLSYTHSRLLTEAWRAHRLTGGRTVPAGRCRGVSLGDEPPRQGGMKRRAQSCFPGLSSGPPTEAARPPSGRSEDRYTF